MATAIVLDRFARVDRAAYEDLWRSCGSPAFYHPAMLCAIEAFPMLPFESVTYIALMERERMTAFVVVYLQREPDPFGTLQRATGLTFGGDNIGLLGHIPHCYETAILVRDDSLELRAAALDVLRAVARERRMRVHGLINIADPRLLEVAERRGMAISYMHDRFYADLTPYREFEHFVAELPRHGRQEMNRQLRKFEAAGGTTSIEAPPLSNLDEVVQLCHMTTAKYGTPQYYPPATFGRFIESCGDLVRLISVRKGDRRVAAVVCFVDPGRFHMWAGGIDYADCEFSPYTLMFAAGFRHAFASGVTVVEGGRTNAKTKQRLGFMPRRLYAAIHTER